MTHIKFQFLTADYSRSVQDYDENWKTLDETLYQLCSDHQTHQDLAAVTAKVAIIGRTYATGIERKVSTTGSPGSAISQVITLFFSQGRQIDDWISRLAPLVEPFTVHSEILTVHGLIVKLLSDLTIDGESARSFVSKYLHFHKPIVPIYDNVAAGFIPKLVRRQEISIPIVEQADATYAEYVCRFAKLYDLAKSQGVAVTVRSLDWYLMWKKANSSTALAAVLP